MSDTSVEEENEDLKQKVFLKRERESKYKRDSFSNELKFREREMNFECTEPCFFAPYLAGQENGANYCFVLTFQDTFCFAIRVSEVCLHY